MRVAQLRNWARYLPLVLLALGATLVAVAARTPTYTDPAAFEAEMQRIFAASVSAGADLDRLSAAFHAAHDRFETSKWLLADLGYVAIAWGLFGAGIVWRIRRRGWRAVGQTQRGAHVVLLLAVALILLLIGLLAGGLQPFQRHQLPWWADSPGVWFFSVAAAMVLYGPVLSLLCLAGLFRRTAPIPLWTSATRPYWRTVLVTLIYAVPLALTALLALDVVTVGSWASSPAGALLFWLLLNSRGLLIAPPKPAD